MGMSTHVVGFKPPDEKWKKMKQVRDACLSAGIGILADIEKFFNYEYPDGQGVIVDLEGANGCLKRYRDDSREGYELDVTKLPKDVTVVRFYNSY